MDSLSYKFYLLQLLQLRCVRFDFCTIGDTVVRDPFHRNDSSRYLLFFYLFIYSLLAMTRKGRNMQRFVKANIVFIIQDSFID